MQVCTCFLLFGVSFGTYTHSSSVTTLTQNKRGVNLTLKSIPEHNAKETSKNDNVATNNTISQPHSTVETFTDFMQELVTILNTYNDDIFGEFVDIVDKEIKKYPSQNGWQNLLVEQSNLLMKKSVAAKRAVINQIVDMMKLIKIFDTNVRELLDYVNSLYRKDAKKKFQIILTDLKNYSAGYGNSRTKDDFARLIRECVRATVFIHGNLNTDVKQKLKKHTDTFLIKIKEFFSSTSISSTATFVTFKPPISKTKSNTTIKIADNIFTEDKTPKTFFKLNATETTAHIKEENKRIRVFRADSSEAKQEDATITQQQFNDNSKRNESNSQSKNITHSHTNETATEVMFYMTTEKLGIVFRSESKSKLVEKMFEETNKTTERQVIGQSTTTPGKRFSSTNELGRSKEIPKQVFGRHTLNQFTTKMDLRRTEVLPLPGEELSVEIFDRDRRRKRKKTHTRSSKFTTEPPELKDYIKRLRLLKTQLDELKSINEYNHNSKRYKDLENNGIDEHETKDKKHSNKRKPSKNLKKRKHSYEHEIKVQREINKVDDTEKDVRQTNSVSKDREVLGRGVEIKDEDIHHHSYKVIHKKKDRRSKSKKTTKTARYKDLESNGIDEYEIKGKKSSNKRKESKNIKKGKHSYKHEEKAQREINKVTHKKKDTRSKSKKTTKTAKTSTKPNKYKSKKKLVLRSSESLSTVKDNAVNKKHAKSSFKTTKKVQIITLNVSEEIKQSSIDETATKGIIKVSQVNMNETTTAHSLRRIIEAFPSLFEKHTLQGLYPAHLWN